MKIYSWIFIYERYERELSSLKLKKLKIKSEVSITWAFETGEKHVHSSLIFRDDVNLDFTGVEVTYEDVYIVYIIAIRPIQRRSCSREEDIVVCPVRMMWILHDESD